MTTHSLAAPCWEAEEYVNTAELCIAPSFCSSLHIDGSKCFMARKDLHYMDTHTTTAASPNHLPFSGLRTTDLVKSHVTAHLHGAEDQCSVV